jgi:dephospho-CoA kinase
MIVGIAGAYCAGKNAVAEVFAEKSFDVVDVDRIGHEVLDENRERVIQVFGMNVLSPDGGINRRILGQIVFRRPKMLEELERIVHPGMVARVKAIVDKKKERVVINAAVLFKMGLHTICDAVICVTAPVITRLRRAMARDSLSFGQALRRICAQRGICPKTNSGDVDIYFVRNSGDRSRLKGEVQSFLKGRKENGK